jgi:FkbM family methyltransferase
MKLKQLLSLRRYRRCARIFRRPLKVHLQVAAAQRQPLRADLLGGGSLDVADARACRPMFDWLLEQSPDPLPVAMEDALVTFHHAGRPVALPPTGTSFLIFREIFADDVYQLDALSKRLGTVVDIGANVGLFALRAAPLAERIICVEPVAENLATARRNIARAGESGRITLHKAAAAGESGRTASIHLCDGNNGAHSMRREHAAQWGTAGYEEAPTIGLADLFETHDIRECSLLKCDAEGAEFDIFQNAPREILERVERIALEVHLTAGDWDLKRFRALCGQLEAAGFRLEYESPQDRQGQPKRAFLLWASRNPPAAGTRHAA